MARFARYCQGCETTVWLDAPHEPCGTCGGLSADVRASIGVAIKCVHWDRVNEKGRTTPTGFHRGVNDFITSKRDLMEKAARKNLQVEFAYSPGRGRRVMG